MRAVCVIAFFSVSLFSHLQAQPVLDRAAPLNAAGLTLPGLPNSALAPGSLFLLRGRGLGPVGSFHANVPLPTSLQGVSVRVTMTGVGTDARIVAHSSGMRDANGTALSDQVVVLLPSTVSPGTGTLTLTNKGQTSASLPITVVRTALEFFDLGGTGIGAALATDLVPQLIIPVASAAADSTISLYGTGLGAIAGKDEELPIPGQLSTPLEVFIGGQAAQVLYKGRAPCCPGVDQIIVKVPASLSGCSHTVYAKSDAWVSNTVNIALGTAGKPCVDPLTACVAEIAAADPAKPVTTGVVAGARSLGSGSLEPTGLVQPVNFTMDNAYAHFEQTASGAAGAPTPLSLPSYGSCVVFNNTDATGGPAAAAAKLLAGNSTRTKSLDPGGTLTLTSPSGATRQMARAPSNATTPPASTYVTGYFANKARDNIHIFVRPDTYGAHNRLTPGSSTIVNIPLPAGARLDIVAGRNGSDIATTTWVADPRDPLGRYPRVTFTAEERLQVEMGFGANMTPINIPYSFSQMVGLTLTGAEFAPDGKPNPLFFEPGRYPISNGAGGADIKGLTGAINVPTSNLNWSNPDAVKTIDRSAGHTVNWNGGDASKEAVLVSGSSETIDASGNPVTGAGFLCTEKAGAGQFKIPPAVLQQLPASSAATSNNPLPNAAISVGTMTLPSDPLSKLSAPGLTCGVSGFSRSAVRSVTLR